MIKINNFVYRAVAVSAVGFALAAVIPGPAFAASKFASKDNFDRSRKCDAILGVSDETTSGKVEAYGGFSCPTGSGLPNTPEKTTIRVRLFMNGQEIVQSKKTSATCNTGSSFPVTCSTDSHQVTYPDYSSTDTFYAKMEIDSFGGNVTLTTGTISS